MSPQASSGNFLDSIDILEIAVAVSKEFKIVINSDEASENNIFLSLRAFSQYIQEAKSADDHVMNNFETMNR